MSGSSGAWDPAERIKDMDTDGVDAEVLYVGGPVASADRELRLNSVRGYNRWLSDYASSAPGRLLGVAAIPIDSAERAAEEIAWAAQQPGLYSGYINWDKGVLYSSEASKLRDLKQCPNCGGEIVLTGKGVARYAW